MEKVNLTIGVLLAPFAEGFAEENNQIVPKLKSLKRFAAISDHVHSIDMGYHDGVLVLMQEGVSAVDVKSDVKFSNAINKDYSDIYELAVAKEFEEPMH
uniref:Uncharacterized protein n=1 Tax=Tetranychus urticae TaxID=32264 RepID=T1KMB9_TETUR